MTYHSHTKKQQNLHLVQVVWLLSLFSSFQPSLPTIENDGKCTTLHYAKDLLY